MTQTSLETGNLVELTQVYFINNSSTPKIEKPLL